ncbi:GNAT family N-acetyltransferase [Nonomuraea sp. SYSU D8015]|uniref:GNAT family N-acetyltransferase n=1 Tax=Nonomuraea sp. SYSU D8015 TaxID=2593644 RepID=UPI00166172B6|nr:GNAT family N-acetyltransferase [Nonomuraea sp. SYSU D8015]
MTFQPIDLERPGELIAGLHDAYVEAHSHYPGPLFSLPLFRRMVAIDRPGWRHELWVEPAEDGEVVGGYGLSLPQLDNTHMGSLFPLVVRPARRGRGLGTALFEHAVGRMRAHGRRLLLAETPVTGVGARFARARGMTVGIVETRRTLDLRKADWPALERMVPQVDGYSLEQWTGPARPELLPDLAALMNGMNDAPRSADVEEQNFSLERVRSNEESILSGGETCYTTIARRDADGAPAAFTRINLNADRSDGWGIQVDTMVLREHRGHRLGLLVKLANLLRLREREPHLERIITWNATSNAHMLAINEALGFELLDEWYEWQLPL